MIDHEKLLDKSAELLRRILKTPGLLDYRTKDGILYLHFEHGVIDMTMPLTNWKEWDKITAETD